MKIAFLNIYNGRVLRGSEIFVHELAERLSFKHSVSVFQLGAAGKHSYKPVTISRLPFLAHQQGIIVSLLYTLTVLLFTLASLPKLLRENFDWIIPINGRFQVLLCRLLRFIKGTKILVSGHSGIGFDDKVNILVGKPDVFVALSQRVVNWAKNINNTLKVVYIPNGIDTELFNPQVRPAAVALKKPLVVCVAALVPYKRIHLLVEAVARMEQVNLLVIGDGPLREEIIDLAKSKLAKRFILIPSVVHKKMPGYYRAASVFSLPSEGYEAFGLTYLEALACNIPVVAPDDKNRRDIIADAGLYCDVSDAYLYKDALEKALHTNFGDRPLNRAQRYSWKHIAKEYEKVLED